MEYSVEEINLMCIFEHSSRNVLIEDMTASLPYIDDSEMASLMEQTIHQLERMSDAEFAELDLDMDFDDDGWDEEDYNL
jgi:hypothetical protein